MMRSFVLLIPALLLSACAMVPLPGRGSLPDPRPVKPLMEGRSTEFVTPPPKKGTAAAVKLEDPTTVKKKTATRPNAKLSPAEIKAKLQEAEDKSASAQSLSESAQSPEDWQLVVQQWNKAIVLLKPLATSDKAMSAKIQQTLASAQIGLDRARASQVAPKSTRNAPIQFDRSPSKSQGLIYGGQASPNPSASPSTSPKPEGNSPVSPSPSPSN